MNTEQNNYFESAGQTLYELLQDERFVQACKAREEYLREQADIDYLVSNRDKQISKQDKQISMLKAEISAKNMKISALTAEIAELKAQLAKAGGNNA